MRETHYLLDIGCGSLRGGRFLMMYLLQNHYFGVEPEKWLIEDGIKFEVGKDLINLKKPTFDYNSDANLGVFDKQFDFILAHSIFFHANKSWIEKCLKEAQKVLKDDGIFMATVKFSENNGRNDDDMSIQWEYPASKYYTIPTFKRMVDNAKLVMDITDLIHPFGNHISWLVIKHR